MMNLKIKFYEIKNRFELLKDNPDFEYTKRQKLLKMKLDNIEVEEIDSSDHYLHFLFDLWEKDLEKLENYYE